jgi:3-oxoacyl-[acyl-carrier protein] reductase
MWRAVTDPLTTALVTGAGRDREIGTAVCRALAAAGHPVVFTVPPGGDGSALAAELGARAVEADLAAPGAAAALLDAVGPVGVLVNNAAHGVNAGYAELDEASLDAHYAVNVRTPVMLTCELARRHEPGTPGRVVCLVSGQSLGPMPGELAYTASKAALETFTQQFAAEVAALGITVNAVGPGPNDTGWIDDALRAELEPRFPMGRIGRPEDAARVVAWLCSDAAAWVTGQVIHAEGGFRRG